MDEKEYRLSIILLAAGDSKRFVGNKMLAPIGGESMYLHMIKNIENVSAYKKVIVTQYQEILNYLQDSKIADSIIPIRNDYSERGISYSIQLGIECCRIISGKENTKIGLTDAYLFAVCDQPWLTQKSIEKLIEVFIHSEKKIACLSYQGVLGNPVIFDEYYCKELLNLKGDIGGKSIVKRHLDDVETVEVYEQKELADIDTQQEYDSLK